MPALEVRDLRVELTPSGVPVTEEVSFTVEAGQVLGMVGESGSGKSTVAMALLGFARRGVRIAGGSVTVGGRDLLTLSPPELRAARGSLVAYVPQDPAVSLNPTMRVGAQLLEVVAAAPDRAEGTERVRAVLSEVELPADDAFLRKYPHEMSGGQQQRVAIAMAVLPGPTVLVLDEPTTGLDVSTQARVLDMVGRLCREHEMAAVYVSHDLGVVAAVADRILVLYGGRVVELGDQQEVYTAPRHPYTIGLLGSVPTTGGKRRLVGVAGQAPRPGHRPPGCAFAPRCGYAAEQCTRGEPPLTGGRHRVRCLKVDEVTAQRSTAAAAEPLVAPTAPVAPAVLSVRGLAASYGTRRVLSEVSLDLPAGQCLALVGESGSGKSTLSRCLIGLHDQWEGEVLLGGVPLRRRAVERDRDARRRMQYVFQNPYASLNPRQTIGESVAVPLRLFLGERGPAIRTRVAATLDRVGLPPRVAGRFPGELSGGERQRAAIARAIVAGPEVLLCDEVTSALDVSVQATVVELLRELMTDTGLSVLFVTHDLGVVRSIADRIAVLERGRVVELAAADDVFATPRAEYTRALLRNTPGFAGVAS